MYATHRMIKRSPDLHYYQSQRKHKYQVSTKQRKKQIVENHRKNDGSRDLIPYVAFLSSLSKDDVLKNLDYLRRFYTHSPFTIDEVIYTSMVPSVTKLLYSSDNDIIQSAAELLIDISCISSLHNKQIMRNDKRFVELLFHIMCNSKSVRTIACASELLDAVSDDYIDRISTDIAAANLEKIAIEHNEVSVLKPVCSIIAKITQNSRFMFSHLLSSRLQTLLNHWCDDLLVLVLKILRYRRTISCVEPVVVMLISAHILKPKVCIEAIKFMSFLFYDCRNLLTSIKLEDLLFSMSLMCHHEKSIQYWAVMFIKTVCMYYPKRVFHFECIQAMLETLENADLSTVHRALYVLQRLMGYSIQAVTITQLLEGEKKIKRVWAGASRQIVQEILSVHFSFQDPFYSRLKEHVSHEQYCDLSIKCIQ
jgi:hypothetical protein